ATSAWLAPERRPDPGVAESEVTDHNGRRQRLGDLRGQPAFVSFFYTRCDNPGKCSATVSSYARLQQAPRKVGLESKVRLVLLTYDPGYDDPRRLANYGEARGLELGPQAVMFRPAVSDVERLCDRLRVNAHFSAGAVGPHGIQAILLDREGRIVRSYHST